MLMLSNPDESLGVYKVDFFENLLKRPSSDLLEWLAQLQAERGGVQRNTRPGRKDGVPKKGPAARCVWAARYFFCLLLIINLVI